MMYVLTAEEYSDLLERKAAHDGIERAKLQAVCTKVADELPIVTWKNDGKPSPWGCILTKGCDWYCDECPVREICPHPHKEWSK